MELKAVSKIVLVLLVLSMFGSAYGISSTNMPTISVCPSDITVHMNEVFSVNITVTNVTELYGYQLMLFYNKTVLRCIGGGLPHGHLLDSENMFIVRLQYDNDPEDKELPFRPQYNNKTHGWVEIALCLLGDQHRNGSGTLATIYFNATAIGSTALHFREVILVNYTSIEAIPTLVIDGCVTVIPPSTVVSQGKFEPLNMKFNLLNVTSSYDTQCYAVVNGSKTTIPINQTDQSDGGGKPDHNLPFDGHQSISFGENVNHDEVIENLPSTLILTTAYCAVLMLAVTTVYFADRKPKYQD